MFKLCGDCSAQKVWLPFTDKVDWENIALIVHKDNTSEIPDLIARTDITVSCQPAMQHHLRRH